MSFTTFRTPRVEDADSSDSESESGTAHSITTSVASDGWRSFVAALPRRKRLEIDFRTNPFLEFMPAGLFFTDVSHLNPPIREDRTVCFFVTLHTTIGIEFQGRNHIVKPNKPETLQALRTVRSTAWRASTYYIKPAILLGGNTTVLMAQNRACVAFTATAQRSDIYIRAITAEDDEAPKTLLPDRLPGWSSNLDTGWIWMDGITQTRYRSGPHLLRLPKDEADPVSLFCPAAGPRSGTILDEELAVRRTFTKDMVLPVFPKQWG